MQGGVKEKIKLLLILTSRERILIACEVLKKYNLVRNFSHLIIDFCYMLI